MTLQTDKIGLHHSMLYYR